jgi:hypothetical protein
LSKLKKKNFLRGRPVAAEDPLGGGCGGVKTDFLEKVSELFPAHLFIVRAPGRQLVDNVYTFFAVGPIDYWDAPAKSFCNSLQNKKQFCSAPL